MYAPHGRTLRLELVPLGIDLARCDGLVSLPGLSSSGMTKKTAAGGCSPISCPPAPFASSATSPRPILPVWGGGGAPAIMGEEDNNSGTSHCPYQTPLSRVIPPMRPSRNRGGGGVMGRCRTSFCPSSVSECEGGVHQQRETMSDARPSSS